MMKIIKKSLIILLLLTIDTVAFIANIIHKFYEKNKCKFENYSKGIYCVLKEELSKD